jgi:cytochrome oxidase Cu insertion factor (SCO1/SenC/PrrC family)
MRRGFSLLLLCLLCSCGPAPEALPRLGEVPGFRLIATDGGKPFSVEKRDLLKRPWVASFLFTSCGGPCPAVAATLGGLQSRLEGRARLVTFTVDPETDTAETLARYAHEVGARPQRWWFLTGDKTQVYRLLSDGFKVAVVLDKSQPSSFRVTHSTKLVLVDAGGAIRGYYDSADAQSLRALESDIRKL